VVSVLGPIFHLLCTADLPIQTMILGTFADNTIFAIRQNSVISEKIFR